MLDIAQTKVDIPCPNPGCNEQIKISLKQVEQQDLIICPKCKEEIKLIDQGGETKKGIKEITKSLKKLSNGEINKVHEALNFMGIDIRLLYQKGLSLKGIDNQFEAAKATFK